MASLVKCPHGRAYQSDGTSVCSISHATGAIKTFQTRPQCRRHGARVPHVAATLVKVTDAFFHVQDGQTSKCILDQVNFSIQAGELHMLVGPNGCGKVQIPCLDMMPMTDGAHEHR
jgi:ABC-type transport system involved in cytochrome bd biosynthesis fused ATPase/permease subunit